MGLATSTRIFVEVFCVMNRNNLVLLAGLVLALIIGVVVLVWQLLNLPLGPQLTTIVLVSLLGLLSLLVREVLRILGVLARVSEQDEQGTSE